MANKFLLVLVLTAFVATGAFAQVTFGGGLLFCNDFGGGVKVSERIPGVGTLEAAIEMPSFGFGAFIFLDVTYAEISLGYINSSTDMNLTASLGSSSASESLAELSVGSLNFAVFGKYPFKISDAITAFPLLGIDYNVVFSAMDGNTVMTDAGDLSALWFKFGGGMDYSITNLMYLRFSALYGIRLPNKLEDTQKDMLKYLIDEPGVSVDTRLGHGLTIRLAIGSKF